jgi:hypothetical protein
VLGGRARALGADELFQLAGGAVDLVVAVVAVAVAVAALAVANTLQHRTCRCMSSVGRTFRSRSMSAAVPGVESLFMGPPLEPEPKPEPPGDSSDSGDARPLPSVVLLLLLLLWLLWLLCPPGREKRFRPGPTCGRPLVEARRLASLWWEEETVRSCTCTSTCTPVGRPPGMTESTMGRWPSAPSEWQDSTALESALENRNRLTTPSLSRSIRWKMASASAREQDTASKLDGVPPGKRPPPEVGQRVVGSVGAVQWAS